MLTIEAHCKIEPMTQMIPERITVFLRPNLSARALTASAPTNEPAGIAATIAP